MQECYIFPVFEWVFDGHWISTGHGKVIDNMLDCINNSDIMSISSKSSASNNKILANIIKAETAAREKGREDEMYMRQVIYNWRLKPHADDPDDKMPGHVDIEDPDKLPPNLKWAYENDRIFKDLKNWGIKELNLSKFIDKDKGFTTLKEFTDLMVIQNLRKRKIPSCIYKNWMTDYEFGRQFCDGIFHRSLHQVKSIKQLNQKTSFKNIKLSVKDICIDEGVIF